MNAWKRVYNYVRMYICTHGSMNVCTYVIYMYICLCVCVCVCVCVCARSLACAHQSSHTKLRLRQCLSNFSNACEPICFRCAQRSADRPHSAISTEYYHTATAFTERQGRAIHQSYVNDCTWDRGRRHNTNRDI